MNLGRRRREEPIVEPTLERADWQLIVRLLQEAAESSPRLEAQTTRILAVLEPRLELPDVESMMARRARLQAEERDTIPTGWPESMYAAANRDMPRVTVGW